MWPFHDLMVAMDQQDAAVTLWLTCASLLLGAYIPGVIALMMPALRDTGHWARTVSAGLLLSAGLCVVLPEGFTSLVEAQASIPEEEHVPVWSPGAALLGGFLVMAALDTCLHQGHTHGACSAADGHHNHHHHDTSAHDHTHTHTATQIHAQQPSHGSYQPPHLALERRCSADLNLGMQKIWMAAFAPPPCCNQVLVTDECVECQTQVLGAAEPEAAHEPNQTVASPGTVATTGNGVTTPLLCSEANHPGITTTSLVIPCSGIDAAAAPRETQEASVIRAQSLLVSSNQALLGLVLHSAADGLAVGAAALSNSLVVSLTVAMSVMVHKMPVAYGLAAFLRGSGRTAGAAHRGLLWFVLAAPVAALVTYYGLGNMSWVTQPQVVSLVLLASGGTVLHAGAVHVLPGAGKSPIDLLIMTLSSLVPLVAFAIVGDHD